MSILREGSWEFQVRLGLGINLELLGHHMDKTKSVGGSSKCFNMRVCVRVHVSEQHLYYVIFMPPGIVI